MSKIVRKRILEAIEKDPHKKDFESVSIFGSHAYGKPKKNSDIDILIEFKATAKIGLFELVRIQRNMEEVSKKKIDLVTREGLSKYIKKEVLANAEKIY